MIVGQLEIFRAVNGQLVIELIAIIQRGLIRLIHQTEAITQPLDMRLQRDLPPVEQLILADFLHFRVEVIHRCATAGTITIDQRATFQVAPCSAEPVHHMSFVQPEGIL